MNQEYRDLTCTEKKFISTNISYLNRYLDKLNLIKEEDIMETFYQGDRYRKYITNAGSRYTKKTQSKNAQQIEISKQDGEKLFFMTNRFIKKKRRNYQDANYQIHVDAFERPNTFIMITVSGDNLERYNVPKGFVDITNLDEFEDENILNGAIKETNIILEGTDAIGKSETIKRLLLEGIICKDRESSVISANMLFDIPMEVRTSKYLEFLKESKDILIFLINNDKEELLRRVHLRDSISDFDLETYEYNQLYKQTYEYMQQQDMLEEKLYMVDCTGLNIEEQVSQVRKVIKRHA